MWQSDVYDICVRDCQTILLQLEKLNHQSISCIYLLSNKLMLLLCWDIWKSILLRQLFCEPSFVLWGAQQQMTNIFLLCSQLLNHYSYHLSKCKANTFINNTLVLLLGNSLSPDHEMRHLCNRFKCSNCNCNCNLQMQEIISCL